MGVDEILEHMKQFIIEEMMDDIEDRIFIWLTKWQTRILLQQQKSKTTREKRGSA
ncbi:hypothetical protein Syun_027559 [Stephania yunnanensis]|uniref:Uncharacterized protein n=1 Tax=Stephania yunnanensis TaxID=152371 RepID=A0AAP0EN43_9MAGN